MQVAAKGMADIQSAELPPDLVGRTLMHYRVTEKIGAGGMGEVYKAEDVRLGRVVAIKVLAAGILHDDEARHRFQREARILAQLSHPHILSLFDIDRSEGFDFIAMEWVEGKTLDKLIDCKGIDPDEALKYAAQMAEALTQAHARGIIHRDLKPSNVMITAEGSVKLLDFGLAKVVRRQTAGPADVTTSTEEGRILGTVAYMSPEQAQGKKVDWRSDIFSFGSTLYEMISGRRAFSGDSAVSTLAAIVRDQPAPIGEYIPPTLRKVVERCMRKDPERRFQSMADVKVELEEAKEEVRTGVSPAEAHPRATKWKLAAIAASILAGLSLVAAGIAVKMRPREPTLDPSMRLTITLPPDMPLAPAGIMQESSDRPALALSPDGSRLAYVSQIGTKTRRSQRQLTTAWTAGRSILGLQTITRREAPGSCRTRRNKVSKRDLDL